MKVGTPSGRPHEEQLQGVCWSGGKALDRDAVAVVPVLEMPPLYSLGFDFAECFESLDGTDAMESGRNGERQRDG